MCFDRLAQPLDRPRREDRLEDPPQPAVLRVVHVQHHLPEHRQALLGERGHERAAERGREPLLVAVDLGRRARATVTTQKPGLSTNCSNGLSPIDPGDRRLVVPGDPAVAAKFVEPVVGHAARERRARRQVEVDEVGDAPRVRRRRVGGLRLAVSSDVVTGATDTSRSFAPSFTRVREVAFGNLQMFRPGDAGWFRWLPASATGPSLREKPQQIADELRALIVSGKLSEGESIGREPELVERFGVSASVVARGAAHPRSRGAHHRRPRRLRRGGRPRTEPTHDRADRVTGPAGRATCRSPTCSKRAR